MSRIIALIVVVILVAAVLGVILGLRLLVGNKSPSSILNQTEFQYYLKNPTIASPIGIASYGIYNYSGSLRTYSINSSEVESVADVSALSAFTTWNDSISSSYSFLACVPCASLQMNVNVVAKTTNGFQSFWVQNWVSFSDTANHYALLVHGLIFNQTTINANVSLYSTGNGQISVLPFAPEFNNTVYGFGSFLEQSRNYSLPLVITLITSVQPYHDGIEVRLSDNPVGNGTFPPTFAPNNDTFGIVEIPINNVTSASIVVNGNVPIPWRYSNGFHPTYDSELVWTAYCCGQVTKFTEMDSNLSLMYMNSSGRFVSYPSFYTFGEVVERGSNLRVIATQTGGQVVVGENNNTLLEN